mgnify:CR=1 FL=1
MVDKWTDASLGDIVAPGALILPFKAASNITKGKAVILSADGEVSQPTSSSNAIGIAVEDASSGDQIGVCVLGIVKVKAGGAISRGQAVQNDANADVIALSDQSVDEGGTATYTIYYSRILGFALDSASASGDYIRILVVK